MNAHISLTDIFSMFLACTLASNIQRISSYRPSARFLSTEERHTAAGHCGGQHGQINKACVYSTNILIKDANLSV